MPARPPTDLPAPLRHLARRPAALDRQRRADRRRTAISRSPAGRCRRCASTTARAAADRAARDRLSPRLRRPLLGGTVELQVNTLAILRTDGQDTQRAFAGARWDLRRFTALGPGGDAHRLWPRRRLPHRRHARDTLTASYRGDRRLARPRRSARWRPTCAGRSSASCSAARSGSRRASRSSPRRRPRNLRIPNEDARAVDLEDSQPLRAQPLPRLRPLGGSAAASPTALEWALDLPGFAIAHGRRAELSPDRQAERSCPTAPACPTASPTSSGAPTCACATSSRSPTATGSTRTIFAVRRNEVDADARHAHDLCHCSAICASTATSTPRSRICATARRCASAGASSSRATGRCSARRWST